MYYGSKGGIASGTEGFETLSRKSCMVFMGLFRNAMGFSGGVRFLEGIFQAIYACCKGL